MITDEDIEKYLTELTCQTRDSDRKAAIKNFARMAIKWVRDQQSELDRQEIETLKSKAYDTLWDPIVDYAQSHKIDGLRLGDSISAFVLKLLKERTL